MADPSPEQAFIKYCGFKEQTVVCSWCGARAALQSILVGNLKMPLLFGDKKYQNVHVGRCRSCEKPYVGLHHGNDQQVGNFKYLYPSTRYPPRHPEAVEQPILSVYLEACDILHRSPMGCAVLARRCVQQLLRSKLNIEAPNLFKEIKIAITRDELSKQTREMLEYVRHIGNWSAHPITVTGENKDDKGDEYQDPAVTIYDTTHEEAALTLGVVEMMFEDLYSKPRVASEWKARIESVKNAEKK